MVAWIETVKGQAVVSVSSPNSTPFTTQPLLAVVIQNNSEEPVHDCVTRVDIARQHWEEGGSRQLVHPRQIVPPGRTEIPMPGLVRRDPSKLPAIWFTDSAGYRWIRDFAGDLVLLPDRADTKLVVRRVRNWLTGPWMTVPPWRHSGETPAVAEEQTANTQDPAGPASTGEPPSADE